MTAKLDKRHLEAVRLILKALAPYCKTRGLNYAAVACEDAIVTLGMGDLCGLDIDAILRNVDALLTGDEPTLQAIRHLAIH